MQESVFCPRLSSQLYLDKGVDSAAEKPKWNLDPFWTKPASFWTASSVPGTGAEQRTKNLDLKSFTGKDRAAAECATEAKPQQYFNWNLYSRTQLASLVE